MIFIFFVIFCLHVFFPFISLTSYHKNSILCDFHQEVFFYPIFLPPPRVYVCLLNVLIIPEVTNTYLSKNFIWEGPGQSNTFS